jgi:hypothetical protein
MAKKLNLKLNYKGKPLDFVRHDKDFVKQFFIGSNKWLYWQILDPSFPDKHLFIQQKGDQLVMNLLPGAQLSCTKDGNAVDSNFLKQNNILNGNQLVLKPDMNGTVALNPDWEISYEFKEPWVVVLTQEEKQIVAQYARRTEPTAVERFNRNMIFLFIFLALVFVILFDLVLKPDSTLIKQSKNVCRHYSLFKPPRSFPILKKLMLLLWIKDLQQLKHPRMIPRHLKPNKLLKLADLEVAVYQEALQGYQACLETLIPTLHPLVHRFR